MSTLFGMLVTDPSARPPSWRVKPGLVEVLGAPTAAKLYRSSIMDLCERYARLSVASRILCYGPRGSRKAVELLASRHWRLIQQQGSSRGQILSHLFENGFRLGRQRLVVMLSDCPTVPEQFIIEAFDRLLIEDVVLGPTTDGGVYLIGMSLERPELLLGLDWDGPAVFDSLVERAEAFGLILGLVPHWYEVNDRAGLASLASHIRALGVMGSEAIPKRTQTLLERLRLAE